MENNNSIYYAISDIEDTIPPMLYSKDDTITWANRILDNPHVFENINEAIEWLQKEYNMEIFQISLTDNEFSFINHLINCNKI